MLPLLPLIAVLLGATSPTPPPGLEVAPRLQPVVQEKRAPQVFRLPLRIPERQLRTLLERELGKRKLLKNFQVVSSKFSNGRVVLDSLDVRLGPRPGTVRLEAHARLRFDRKQLGVRWRGLKSHKKWYDKAPKDAAKVRVTCVAELGALANTDQPLGVSLTKIRVKLVSRLPSTGSDGALRRQRQGVWLDPRGWAV